MEAGERDEPIVLDRRIMVIGRNPSAMAKASLPQVMRMETSTACWSLAPANQKMPGIHRLTRAQ
jgi:hypothetical protein